ncbi:MAG: hypothetical protein WCF67_09315 [Chitinophagaceae bacterium]
MPQQPSYKFEFLFVHNGIEYRALVIPFEEIPKEDLSKYILQENCFIVELQSENAFHTFEIFPDDNFEWRTNVSNIVFDTSVVEIIGCEIDNRWK